MFLKQVKEELIYTLAIDDPDKKLTLVHMGVMPATGDMGKVTLTVVGNKVIDITFSMPAWDGLSQLKIVKEVNEFITNMELEA